MLIEQYGKGIEMKKKVLVLGVLGMAGHIMAEYLDSTNKYHVFGIAREAKSKYVTKELDNTKYEVVEEYLKEIEPDYVINCIGILVSQSKNELTTAIKLNSYLPQYLSELGVKYNYKLIQLSTDCVFSGKSGNYIEDSFRDGDDNYARTKALGEVVNHKDLTIRTSIIGPELKKNGTSLLDWFLKQEGKVYGFSKIYWNGVTTLELAKQVDCFLEQNIIGLFHLCVEEKISKYDLLHLFAKYWSKNIVIANNSKNEVDKSLVCTREDFIYAKKRPSYEKMLNEMSRWMREHPTYYQHYKG